MPVADNRRGIIFDMDNTLLRSDIDFEAMKQRIYQFLCTHDILPMNLTLDDHTTATIIAKAMATNQMTDGFIAEMWNIAKPFEVVGMRGATLEPGVEALLHELHGSYCLAVVTNNAVEAAYEALGDNRIDHYFDCIVGREMVKAIKPAPDGYRYVMEQYPQIPTEGWMVVGDSWIDGKAAVQAGIPFVAYQGDEQKMKDNGVEPITNMVHIHELMQVLIREQID